MRETAITLAAMILMVYGCSTIQTSENQPSEDSTSQLLTYAEAINEPSLHHHLSVIAHDSLEGRETGTRGQKIAADYLRDHYEELGFEAPGDDGSYFQRFTLEAERTDSLVYDTWYIENGDTLLADHSVSSPGTQSEFIQLFGGARDLYGDIVFAGFGVNDTLRGASHLEGIDLTDKWVLVFEEIPYVSEGDTLVSENWTGNHRFSEIVSRKRARGVIVIGSESPEEFESLRKLSSRLLPKPQNSRLAYLESRSPRQGYPRGYVKISPGFAAELLEFDSPRELQRYREELTRSITSFKPIQLPYILDYRPYQRTVNIETENVLALFEGGNPERSDEVVVLTAHYDHIGITQPDDTGDFINNGADDNGSGTTALMVIAEALQQAYQETGERPDRSILFLHVSAEEMGLLGSRYYSDHPVVPIEKTVASYNADMIGRSTTELAQTEDTDYIYIIGGDIISTQLDSLVHVANQKSVNMELDYTYNDLNDPNQFYRRSDHWNLGRLGVPFVFFFTGVHEDYHQPGDSVDKVDLPKLTRTTRLIYSSTIEVANYAGRPEVDNQQFIDITRRLPR